jgi:WD40 repeat protein
VRANAIFAGSVLLGLIAGSGRQTPPGANASGSPKQSHARIDREGVPLPDGILMRLGSSRMRQAGLVYDVAISPDQRFIASAYSRGVRLWDAATGRRLHEWTFAGSDRLRFTPDSRQLICVSSDPRAVIYEFDPISGGRTQREIDFSDSDGITDLIISESGNLLAATHRPKRAGTLVKRIAYVLDRKTGKVTQRISLRQYAQGMAFSPDDRTLAVAQVGRLAFYDTRTGELSRDLDSKEWSFRKVALSPDDRTAITMATDQRNIPEVQIWDLPSATLRHRLSGPDIQHPYVIALSPDGKLAVTGNENGPCVIWDITTGKELRRIREQFGGFSAAFSKDGRTLVVGCYGGTVIVCDVETGQQRPMSASPGAMVRGLRFSDDGRQLWGLAAWPIAWDLETGRELTRFAELPALSGHRALSADGRLLAVAQEPAKIFETETGRERREIRAEGVRPEKMMFSPDGRFLVLSTDSALYGYDVVSATEAFKIDEQGLKPYAFSHDGRWLVTSGSSWFGPSNSVRLWDMSSFREIKRFEVPPGPVEAAGLSPDGRRLATILMVYKRDAPWLYELHTWDVASGRRLGATQLGRLSEPVLAYAPDSRTLATGASDGVLRLWEVATGKERHSFRGDAGPIVSIAWTPDGRTVAASSYEAPVFLWDVYGRLQASRDTGRDEFVQCWADVGGEDSVSAFGGNSPVDCVVYDECRISPQSSKASCCECARPVSRVDPRPG